MILGLTLAALALAGCGSVAPGESAGEPEVTIDKDVVDPRTVVFPLDPDRVVEDSSLVIIHARDVVMQRCLASFGFQVPMHPPVGRETAGVETFGVVEMGDAQRFGYLPPQAGGAKEFVSEVPREARPILRGEVTSFAGRNVPQGGCQGESIRAVTGGDDVPKDGNFLESLRHQAWQETHADSRVKMLFDQWRSCVRDVGFPSFRDPAEPYAHWSGRREPAADAPSQEEVEMAIADVRCKQQVELMPTWIAVTIAYQARLAEANAERIAEHQDYVQAAMERANKIIAEG